MTTNWKPMDLAPRDGTQILVAGSYGFTIVSWQDESVLTAAGWFAEIDGEVMYNSHFYSKPTHAWADLPQPPTEAFLKTLKNREIKSNSA